MSDTAPASWQLYIVRTATGSLYTGISNNVPRRFQQHQKGTGAKALRGKGPLELLFTCEAGDRAMASRLEYQVKQLSREEKLRLVANQPDSLPCWLSDRSG